jgi:hypothetical protein
LRARSRRRAVSWLRWPWCLGRVSCRFRNCLTLPGRIMPRTGADGGSRTRTGFPPQDFKSCVSTSSTTSAIDETPSLPSKDFGTASSESKGLKPSARNALSRQSKRAHPQDPTWRGIVDWRRTIPWLGRGIEIEPRVPPVCLLVRHAHPIWCHSRLDVDGRSGCGAA